MDDAGARVSRYLLMQLVVNVTYGIPVAIGLYFIGVPNAVLWGAFATVLRFIPYIGPWIGAAIPDRPLAGRLAGLDDAAADHRPFRRARTAEQQRHGAVALWLEHRCFPHRADHRGGVLDVALGPGRARARDAAHRLPRRHGAARPAPLFSERAAER